MAPPERSPAECSRDPPNTHGVVFMAVSDPCWQLVVLLVRDTRLLQSALILQQGAVPVFSAGHRGRTDSPSRASSLVCCRHTLRHTPHVLQDSSPRPLSTCLHRHCSAGLSITGPSSRVPLIGRRLPLPQSTPNGTAIGWSVVGEVGSRTPLASGSIVNKRRPRPPPIPIGCCAVMLRPGPVIGYKPEERAGSELVVLNAGRSTSFSTDLTGCVVGVLIFSSVSVISASTNNTAFRLLSAGLCRSLLQAGSGPVSLPCPACPSIEAIGRAERLSAHARVSAGAQTRDCGSHRWHGAPLVAIPAPDRWQASYRPRKKRGGTCQWRRTRGSYPGSEPTTHSDWESGTPASLRSPPLYGERRIPPPPPTWFKSARCSDFVSVSSLLRRFHLAFLPHSAIGRKGPPRHQRIKRSCGLRRCVCVLVELLKRSLVLSLSPTPTLPPRQMDSRYQRSVPLQVRRAEGQRIREKHPDKIPIIVERVARARVPELQKKKYLDRGTGHSSPPVPRLTADPLSVSSAVGQFCFLIRQRISLRPEEALFFFVDNALPPSGATLAQIYQVSPLPGRSAVLTALSLPATLGRCEPAPCLDGRSTKAAAGRGVSGASRGRSPCGLCGS
ncbi:GBRL1 protein, partial [Atractosteus spatula]|nr:GBRL1 protein [Atractosteus spatula]